MRRMEEEVATHVLVSVDIAEELRSLSRRTRVTQSEYLREAVLDLLRKYDDGPADAGALEETKPHG